MTSRIVGWLYQGRRAARLQTRFMLSIGVIVVTLMTAVILVVEQRQSATMLEQTEKRSVAVAKSIAAVVKSALYSYDYNWLQQAAETAVTDEGVLYVVIYDKEGTIAGYSGQPERQGQTPSDAFTERVLAASGVVVETHERGFEPNIREAHLDVAVPVWVEHVKWGTIRVGLSLESMAAELSATRRLLVLVGVVAVGIVLLSARFLSRTITQPLEELARATAVIASGDLDHSVTENLPGELGELARSFNKMTFDLKRSRDAIRYQNQHLENMVQERTAALREKARELERANAELKELDRLKSDFLSNVSHELRTPLTSIRSFTEIMLDQGFELDDGQRREFLEIVASQADRLTRLISDLLDLSKIEAGEFHCQLEPMHLDDVVTVVVETLKNLAADKGVTLRAQLPDRLPPILGDADRISQVLTNLIDNALKFTPEGGTVDVTAQLSPHRRRAAGLSGGFAGMECDTPETGDYVVMAVRDSGVGIRPEDQERIFEKFGQVGNVLTDKPQGTGLGLTISGTIMVQHGGALWVESTPGQGSVFAFSIPVASRAVQVAPEPARSNGREQQHAVDELVQTLERTASGQRILVVDDEPSIVAAITELLEPLGYRAIGCTSGSQAVARARDVRPDAVILDIMMPEINGYDVLRLLKGDPQTADIPVIVLSVLEDAQRAFELGASEYISKPFDASVLLDNVRALA